MKSPAKTKDKQSTKFKKGKSGNPAGRPQGSRNKVSILLDGMLQEQAELLLQTAIDEALSGDSQTLRALIDKLLPNKKDSLINIKIPPATAAKDLSAITGAILKAVGTGKLTPLEATALSKIVDSHRSAIELFDIEDRINKIENKLNEDKKHEPNR